jgi:phospholipase C
MHPIEDVTRAEQLVKWVYDAIRRSPHWNQSLLIIVFDEHGGFYDHIRPPAAAAPNDGVPLGSFHRFDFRQLGVRVPCVIVSPWIPKGYIDETVRDHTSILRTIEEIFELDWLTDRDHGAESLSPLLSASSARNDALPACANPATSGIVQSGWFQQVLERITAFLGIGPASASKPTPLAEAFIHIAGRREVQMQQDSAPAVEERIRNISTQAEAARYVESVRRNYRRARATLNRS